MVRTVVVRRFQCWRLAKTLEFAQVVVIRRFPRHGTVSAKTIVTHALMQSQDEAVLRRSEDTKFCLVLVSPVSLTD
jgi:ABC-type branched-subunit amino acid transport system ATPase component